MTVEDTMDHHLSRLNGVEDTVRKPTKQRSTNVTVHLGVRERILLDTGHAFIERSLELQSEAFALLPIP